MVRRPLYSLLVLALLLLPTMSSAAQVEAVTDRTRTSLEESFTLELRATGSIDEEPDLSVLNQDFEILGRSQSSQMQIINSDISRTTTWSLSLLARSLGRKTIPPICLGVDCSKAVTIDVLPADQASNSLAGERELLLEVSTEPGQLRVQSQLLFKVRILTRLNFLQASLSEPEPTGVEAVVQKLGDDRNYETERNGLRYRAIERSYAIFPQQSGPMVIPEIRFGAQVAEGGRRGFDPFNQRTRQLRKQSERIDIEVLPAVDSGDRNWLPANSLHLEDDWQQPPQLTVGEPATRTISLVASGIPSAQLPPLTLAAPEGVRSYPDQPNREDSFDENGVIGSLQQKLALVPTSPGTLRLPEIKVDWWDLQTESWKQATLPAVDVEVLPQSNLPASATTPPKPQPVPPKPAETALAPQEAGTVEPGPWPWLSLTLGIGWLLTLLLLAKMKLAQRRKPEQSAADEERTQNLKQARRELQTVLNSGDQAQVRRALLRWGAALFPKQCPVNLEELAELCGTPLKQQLETLNRSRYSATPERFDAQELLAAVQQVELGEARAKKPDQLPPLHPH